MKKAINELEQIIKDCNSMLSKMHNKSLTFSVDETKLNQEKNDILKTFRNTYFLTQCYFQ